MNVSSVVATGGPDFLCAYSASKAAVNTVTRNAAYALNTSSRCNIWFLRGPLEH